MNHKKMRVRGRKRTNFSYLLYRVEVTTQVKHYEPRSKYEYLSGRKSVHTQSEKGGNIMNKLSKCKVLLVIMLVVGLSIASAGCDWFGGDDDDDDDNGGIQPSRSVTILNTTLTLSANNGFCAFLPFRLTEVWDTTVRVTGPSNTDPDFYVYSPTGQTVADGLSGASGSEVVTFEPPLTGTYDLEVCDYKNLGGTFNVLITQLME
jgi:hypothetical protein